MMNKVQQQAILQIWTATHSEAELAKAINNLTAKERKFFSNALNFQNKGPSLSGKNFQTLVIRLNGNLSLPGRIRRSVRKFFGGKSNTQSILQSRTKFLGTGSEKLGRINSVLSGQITNLVSTEMTPTTQRKIATLELSKDLIGQALVLSESQSTTARIQKLERELQNPELSPVQRKRKEIALSGLKEKQSQDEFASMRRGTNSLLGDNTFDLMINQALIQLAKNPKSQLNTKTIQNYLNSGDDFVAMKVKKLDKQYRITNALQNGSTVEEKDRVFAVTSKDLTTLLTEREALLTKAAAYELFNQTLPGTAPAA